MNSRGPRVDYEYCVCYATVLDTKTGSIVLLILIKLSAKAMVETCKVNYEYN